MTDKNPGAPAHMLIRTAFQPKQRRKLSVQPQTIFRPESLEAKAAGGGDPFVVHAGGTGDRKTLSVGDRFTVDVENTTAKPQHLTLKILGTAVLDPGDTRTNPCVGEQNG